MRPYIPVRGDAIWLNSNPQAGHEQAGRHPAFVISPAVYHKKVGLALVCPITNQLKGYPFEVEIPKGLSVIGSVLSDQIKSLDWRSRQAAFICKMPDHVTKEVIGKIDVLIR